MKRREKRERKRERERERERESGDGGCSSDTCDTSGENAWWWLSWWWWCAVLRFKWVHPVHLHPPSLASERLQ